MKRFVIALLIGVIGLCSSNCHFVPEFKYTQFPAVEETLNERVIPVYIDADFLEADKVAIDDAIMQWNYVLNGQEKLEIKDANFKMSVAVLKQVHDNDNGIIIISTNSSSPVVPIPTPSAGTRALAWTDGIGGHEIYTVHDRIPDDIELRGVMLHELGHALGADHNKLIPSLMNPVYNVLTYRCIDKWSAQTVAHAQAINAGRVNYCITQE